MSERDLTIKDRLEDILESIGLIEEWSQGMTELHDFMISPGRVMAFNACVMRLQVIGEGAMGSGTIAPFCIANDLFTNTCKT